MTYQYQSTTSSGNVFTIQNTLETVNVTIQKNWNDANDQDGKRSESVDVLVKGTANGQEIYPDSKKFTISKTKNQDSSDALGNSWKFTLTLPKYNKDGYEITYTVQELDADGKVLNEGDKYNSQYVLQSESGDMNEGFIFTNQHTPETKPLTVQKHWEDDNNQDSYRPDTIQIQLYRNDEKIGAVQILSATNG